ncbi:hypothetical protein AURDEDRAFT_175145 [Auricularia subglabra TFB-10046 SS5]|nr:hypothetical protein AURDEDRAFT_175145 [Auricularia subglabra TFB-10046 SS5]
MSLVIVFLLILPAFSRVFNVTIDDALGDTLTGEKPRYDGLDWRPRGAGAPPCDVCTTNPDAGQIVNGTWHDQSTFVGNKAATITLIFDGTAIYVYCILINGVANAFSTTRLSFYLDESSSASGDFLHEEDARQDQYLYNQLVFSRGGLAPGNHSLVVANRADNTGSLVLFDYAVYTTDDSPSPISPPTTPTPTSPVGAGTDTARPSNIRAIVGGSVGGGMVTLLLLAIAFQVYVWRRATADSHAAQTIQPFDTSTARSDVAHPGSSVSFECGDGEASSRLLSEIGWVREELQRVRQLAEPPGYTEPSDPPSMELRTLSSGDGDAFGSTLREQQPSRAEFAKGR